MKTPLVHRDLGDEQPTLERGLCLCGCGAAAPLASATNRKRGDIKGQPTKYILGHSARARIVAVHLCACGRPKGKAAAACWECTFPGRRRPRLSYVVPFEERFWSNVQKTDSCWVWIGSALAAGYGKIGLNGGRILAHRASWELHNGPIPEGLDVLHHCDNPPCVNPDHLWLGDAKDNAADMVAKGRARGRNSRAA